MPKACRLPLVVFATAAFCGCQMPPSKEAAVQHYVAGQLLVDEGRLDEALKELAEAVRNDPDLSVAHTAIGDVQRRRGDYQAASEAYETACQTNPYAFRPHYNLGVVHQVLAEAARTLEQFKLHLKEAVGVYLRAVAIRPDDFEANLNLSACYFQLGKADLAEQYLHEAARIDPARPEAHTSLGIVHATRDRLYDAIREFKTSLELKTDQPRVLLELGRVYMRQGRLRHALKTLKLAAAGEPGHAPTWETIAACQYHLADLDAAAAAYERAISLDAGSADAYRGLGVVHMTRFLLQGGEEPRDRALAAWNRSLELSPGQEDLIRLVGKYTPRLHGPGV